jgi:DNA invertase Pin-like site-specific DNA recombinase
MLIGYARTSTTDQQAGFDAQLVELETYGCERILQRASISCSLTR